MYQTLYLFWPIHYCMNYFFTNDKDINLNCIKLTHSIVSSSLTYYFVYHNQSSLLGDYIYHCSNSYFLWDTLQLLYERNTNNLPYCVVNIAKRPSVIWGKNFTVYLSSSFTARHFFY